MALAARGLEGTRPRRRVLPGRESARGASTHHLVWVVSSAGLAAAAAALLVGCEQEMLKATPFASGEHARTEGPPEGRVNLWPLLYHRAPATSFLWPVGEVTDTTWAVRPIVAAYDRKLDVLWPFVHADGGKGSGYLFPFLWWGKHRFAVIPLFATRQDPGERWLWTPVYGAGSRLPGPRSWLYTPAFVSTSHGPERFHLLPPLLSWWNVDADDGGWDAQLLLSVAGIRRGSQRNGEHLAPFFWRDRQAVSDGKKELLMILPAYAGYDRVQGGSTTESVRALPLLLSGWSTRLDPETGESFEGTRVYGPLYVSHQDPRWNSRAVPLLLSWTHARTEGGTDWHLLLSAVAWGGTPASPFSRVIPFYYSSGDETRGAFGLPFLLYGSRWSEFERRRAIVPFYWRRTRGNDLETRILLGLAGSQRSPDRREHHVFPLYSWSHRSFPHWRPPSEVAAAVPGPPAGWEDVSASPPPAPKEEDRFRLLLLVFDTLDTVYDDGSEYHRSRVLWRLWHDERSGRRRSLDVFPFFTYDDDGAGSLTWSWLYTFLRYERRGGERHINLFFLPRISI